MELILIMKVVEDMKDLILQEVASVAVKIIIMVDNSIDLNEAV
jgi:hypothetical protein